MHSKRKKGVAFCLVLCGLLGLAPPRAAAAALEPIYIENGEMVTINISEYHKYNYSGYDYDHYIHRVLITDASGNGKSYTDYDIAGEDCPYPTRKYEYIIINGTVTSETPKSESGHNNWGDYEYTSEKNTGNMLTYITTGAEAAVSVMREGKAAVHNGADGVAAIYRITTPPDSVAPSLSLGLSSYAIAQNPVTVTATASDNRALHAAPYSFNNSGWSTANRLTVQDNCTVNVRARDKAGNITSKDVVIGNIDKIPPSLMVSVIPTNSDAAKVPVVVFAQDNSREKLDYSFDGGATWQDANMFEAPPDVELKIWVRDIARNIAKAVFTPTYADGGGSSVPQPLPVTVFGNAELEASIFSATGVVKNGVYKSYAMVSHIPEAVSSGKTRGIEIKLEVKSKAENKYLAGKARLGGTDYPVHWNSFNGSTVIPAGNATGYIYIDKSEFKSSYKNARMKVSVGEYQDAQAHTKITEGTDTVYVTIDVSPPSINAAYSRGSRTVTIDTFDSVSGVKDVLYSIDGKGYARYTAPFKAPSTAGYIDITAVDMAENSAASRLELKQDGGAGSDSTPAEIYTYKTQNTIAYMINGGKANTKTLNLADFKVG